MPDEEPALELVMPFLTVTSKGGPHEDEAYTAGWEMGSLDELLASIRPPLVERPIRSDNAPQADLVAMKHGYSITLTEQGDGWHWMQLSRPVVPTGEDR